MIANGKDLYCIVQCEKFEVKIQGQNFYVDVYTLPLDNYDLNLGSQWLADLGDIVWNFKKLIMKFSVEQ